MILDLGCGDLKENWIKDSHGMDLFDYGQKYVWNLTNVPWPIEDNSYDEVVAQHILEHIVSGWDFISILNEVARVLKPNGIFRGAAPNFPTSPNFYRDPTHVRMINQYTFDGFLEGSKINFGPGYNIKCKFRMINHYVNPNQDYIWVMHNVKV